MKNMKAIMESSSVYTAPIFGWISVSYFAKIAHILGNTADEAKYQTTADKMRNAIVAELIDKDGNCVSDMMGAYVLFLYFDLVPEQFRDKFAWKLVQSIEANGGCLDTGFLATPYLLDTTAYQWGLQTGTEYPRRQSSGSCTPAHCLVRFP